jgi:hypothetical protein
MLVSLGCDVFGCHSVKIKGKRSGFPSAWPWCFWVSGTAAALILTVQI